MDTVVAPLVTLSEVSFEEWFIFCEGAKDETVNVSLVLVSIITANGVCVGNKVALKQNERRDETTSKNSKLSLVGIY